MLSQFDKTRWNDLVDFAESRAGKLLEELLVAEQEAVFARLMSNEAPAVYRLQGQAKQLQDLIDLLATLRERGKKA